MYIRKAKRTDANDLTHFPSKEEQDMNLWGHLLDKFERDENMHLLVMEEGGKVVPSVQMAIIENLLPFRNCVSIRISCKNAEKYFGNKSENRRQKRHEGDRNTWCESF